MLGRRDTLAFDGQGLAAILSSIADGNATAFEELYRRTSARLFGICLLILPDRADAEEALQDSYLSIWRRATSFDQVRGQPMTWLIAIARNQAIDRLRAAKPLAQTPIEAAADVADRRADAAEVLLADEEARTLAACLDALAGPERRLIHTAYFQGSTYRELAQRSNTPLGTVKTRIRRALAQLRDCLR